MPKVRIDMAADSLWSELAIVAPRTQSLIESCAKTPKNPVLWEIPVIFEIPGNQYETSWADVLGSENALGVSNRELLLRWLLTRAIVDQGSDIHGVRLWHNGLVSRCYEVGIRFLHSPSDLISRYPEFIKIATEERDEVIASRAAVWASEGTSRRYKNSYNVFNVDGQRSFSKHTHAFVAGRMLPGLFTSLLVDGGLTELIFGRANSETPREMARRIKDGDRDKATGLGGCIGDKACDLFVKWAVGEFNLGAGLDIPWEPADCPLPMDQRVGRVLMRCGFMDEFFGVVQVASTKSNGLTPPPGVSRPSIGSPIPLGVWHLTVKDFRRQSFVRDNTTIDWLVTVSKTSGSVRPKKWHPQDVLSSLCRAYNLTFGTKLSPVDLDDFLMNLAEGCRDAAPLCTSCFLESCCQANNDISMSELKKYKT